MFRLLHVLVLLRVITDRFLTKCSCHEKNFLIISCPQEQLRNLLLHVSCCALTCCYVAECGSTLWQPQLDTELLPQLWDVVIDDVDVYDSCYLVLFEHHLPERIGHGEILPKDCTPARHKVESRDSTECTLFTRDSHTC